MQTSSADAPIAMPDNFAKIVADMADDLATTFPEHAAALEKWTTAGQWQMSPSESAEEMRVLFAHCLATYPAHFFDIVNQNPALFENAVLFLPEIDFAPLFHCSGVSESTRQIMWKYLQLMLITLLGCVRNKSDFGDAARMFEGIDDAELQSKISATIAGMSDFFRAPSPNESTPGAPGASTSFAFDGSESVPLAGEVHDHLRGLFDGKIGTLAREMAEDLSKDFSDLMGGPDGEFGESSGGVPNTKDVLSRLMQDPGKLAGLVKTISAKLGDKLSAGDISHDEIMQEATGLLGRMRGAGGGGSDDGSMPDLQRMFGDLAGMFGGPGGLAGAFGGLDLPKHPDTGRAPLGGGDTRLAKQQETAARMHAIGKAKARAAAIPPVIPAPPTAPACALSEREIEEMNRDLEARRPQKKAPAGGKKKRKS